MSLFLGPVHFWLYDKIKNQEALTSLIAEHFGKGAEYTKQLLPLEEVIDEGNIRLAAIANYGCRNKICKSCICDYERK